MTIEQLNTAHGIYSDLNFHSGEAKRLTQIIEKANDIGDVKNYGRLIINGNHYPTEVGAAALQVLISYHEKNEAELKTTLDEL